MRAIVPRSPENPLIRILAGQQTTGSSRVLCCFFILLVGFIGHLTIGRQASAESIASAPSAPPEEATTSPVRGIVRITANLRAFPSLQSEVIAVAKERSSVEILAESGRWYRVRTDEGIDAWIGKSLLQITSAPPKTPPPLSDTALPQEAPLAIEATSPPAELHEVAPQPPELIAPPIEDSPELEMDASPVSSGGVASYLFEAGGVRRFIDSIAVYVKDIDTYLLPLLAGILALAIVSQLRAARQLRRAMYEMGLILDVIEEFSMHGREDCTHGLYDSPQADEKGIPAIRGQSVPMEFSAIERAVLQALSVEQEMHEVELGRALTRQGFADVLLKAVIAEILRKTQATGSPWIEARYSGGQYRYKLCPSAVLNPMHRS